MLLNGFDHASFLRDYWQKKPLLIRHRGAHFVDPIEPDELAGLACEPAMESRLVRRVTPSKWQLQHGPFDSQVFAQLPDADWTLLVQAVDQVVESVEALKQYFSFLPSWRIDDVMISFACAGGGVGPHYDHYDVFLIQGQGSRTWQIGERCDATTALRADTDLSLLKHFRPVAEYVLEPGDILYIPPGFAHHGISRDDSLCYSIGFRAPSQAELIQEFCELLTDSLNEDSRYQDPSFNFTATPGEVSEAVMTDAFEQIAGLLRSRSAFADAFGNFVTRPKYPERLVPPEQEMSKQQLLYTADSSGGAVVLQKNPASRFAYFIEGQSIRLYADGIGHGCPLEQLSLVRNLCDTSWLKSLQLAAPSLSAADTGLLVELINQGSLLVPNDAPDSDD